MPTPLNATQLATVRDTLRAEGKLPAIKLYREYTGACLADSKEAVEKIEAGASLESLKLTEPPVSATVQPAPDKLAMVQQAIFKRNKIEAIRIYREATGSGLADAKAAVEKLETELRQQSPERFDSGGGKGCMVMVMTALLLAVMIAHWARTH